MGTKFAVIIDANYPAGSKDVYNIAEEFLAGTISLQCPDVPHGHRYVKDEDGKTL